MDSKAKQPAFVTTLNYKEFGEHGALIPNMPYTSPQDHSIWDEFKLALRVIQAARHSKVMLLDSSNGRVYPDVIACMVLGFLPKSRRPAIALLGEMWQPNKSLRGMIEHLIVKLTDRAVDRYLVMTHDETKSFPTLWGLDPKKMRVLNYYFSFSDEDLAEPIPTMGTHIFAGGNAHRDYLPLVEAARQLPLHEFILATRRLNDITDLPPNVKAGAVPHQEFVRLMRTAAAVVVPMKSDLVRSAGQQTYLNAMYLEKPTIISDSIGLADYVKDGENGIIVDGSAEGYVKALKWVFDPANEQQVKQLCVRGHDSVINHFSVQHYADRIIYLMNELAEDATSR